MGRHSNGGQVGLMWGLKVVPWLLIIKNTAIVQ